MRTFSPTICSPTRLPPPFFEKKLRPSSAWRASAEKSMKASRSATAAGSRTTVYLPGSIADGFFVRAALSIAVVGERRRAEQPQLVERLRRPARPRAVRRARGQVVVGGGVAVVGEEPLRARHRLHRRLRLDEPGRHHVLLLAQGDRGLDRRRAPVGRRVRRIVEVRGHWARKSAARGPASPRDSPATPARSPRRSAAPAAGSRRRTAPS